jgi:hypothetical protein
MTPLRQRMLEDMGIRNLAENTQLSYLQRNSPASTILVGAGLISEHVT